MASAMDVDDEEIELPTSSSSKGEKKRFEVKKVLYLQNHNLTNLMTFAFYFTVECSSLVGMGFVLYCLLYLSQYF